MHPVPHNKPKVRISDENGVVIISDRQSEAFDQLCAHYPLPTDNPFQWSHWVNFEIQQYDALCAGLPFVDEKTTRASPLPPQLG